jgi:hypothetical protein
MTLQAGSSLIKAATKGNYDDVKACLAKGEGINDVDKYGWSPLMWATYYRYQIIIDYLLDNGANPDIQATRDYSQIKSGATALIIAAYYGQDDQTSSLMRKKANVDLADSSGKKAADYAKEFGFTNVLDIMAQTPGGAAAVSTATKAKGVDDTRLDKTYTKVVLAEFTASKEITKDYRDQVLECQNAARFILTDKKAFESVAMADPAKTPGADTLVLQAEITEIRIPSGAARFWVGAMAGNAYMHVKVKLVDGATGKVAREQLITSENNAWGAAWSWGATDRSLPKDVGAMVASYVGMVAGKK